MNNPRSFFEHSRCRTYDLTQNIIFDYAGTHHVRILKRFLAPGGHSRASLLKPERNKTFHLRFYIPKAALTNREEKIRDIVIMFNGLDELDRFDLYDVLGEHLAENGIAAVLLPTPHHLNRNTPSADKKVVKPHEKLFKTPMLLYYNYKQSMLESELLIKKLRQHVKTDPMDFGFYDSLFDRNLRISIFGFSLGGTRALASFLQEPTNYHTCVVFNSGVELSLLNTKFLKISEEEWKKFLSDLYEKVEKNEASLQNEKYWRYFSGVFLGEMSPWLKERLRKNSHKQLFILSGGDQIVPWDKLKNLEVEGHGLTVFKIAGVGHIPTIDPQWSPWLNRIADVIFHFVSKTGQGIWSHQNIASEFADVLNNTGYGDTLIYSNEEFGTAQLEDLLKNTNDENRAVILKLYYASMAYYPNFRELLNAVVRLKKAGKS
jgi:hypothetical protein